MGKFLSYSPIDDCPFHKETELLIADVTFDLSPGGSFKCLNISRHAPLDRQRELVRVQTVERRCRYLGKFQS